MFNQLFFLLLWYFPRVFFPYILNLLQLQSMQSILLILLLSNPALGLIIVSAVNGNLLDAFEHHPLPPIQTILINLIPILSMFFCNLINSNETKI